MIPLDFDEVFKDHVATYERLKGNLETLKWRNPKSSIYAIYYVAWGGTLMVFGDCYEATYQWCPEDPIGKDDGKGLETSFLNWIANRTTLSYFVSKCKAEPRDGQGLYYWTEEQARETISNLLDDDDYNLDDDACRHFEVTDGWGNLSDEHHWECWVDMHAHRVFGPDYWDDCRVTYPGKTLNTAIRLHHEGLKRAMDQVKAREEEAGPTPAQTAEA